MKIKSYDSFVIMLPASCLYEADSFLPTHGTLKYRKHKYLMFDFGSGVYISRASNAQISCLISYDAQKIIQEPYKEPRSEKIKLEWKLMVTELESLCKEIRGSFEN